MAGFELSERIGRPPAEVFALLTDPARVSIWLPAVTGIEVIGSGPIAPGARLRETRRVMGKEATAELEVVAHEPPTRHAVRNVTSGVDTTYVYTLRPDGDGTEVRLVCDVRGRGLRRLSAALLARVLARQDRDHLVELKEAAERTR